MCPEFTVTVYVAKQNITLYTLESVYRNIYTNYTVRKRTGKYTVDIHTMSKHMYLLCVQAWFIAARCFCAKLWAIAIFELTQLIHR